MEIWLSGILGAGRYAQVDPINFRQFSRYKWLLRNGYAIAIIGGRSVRMHRLVLGETDPTIVVDHIDRNRLNNQAGNLRRLTPIENANNRVDNIIVKAFGEAQTIGEWSRDPRCSVSYHSLQKRIYRGIMPELAILASPTLIDSEVAV